MKFPPHKLPLIYYSLIFLLLFSACSSKTYVTRSRLMMGHVPVNITIQTQKNNQEKAIEASEVAYKKAQALEAKFSEYNPDSEISCLNQKAGKAFCDLSIETIQLLHLAQELNRETAGAFDIRFASKTHKGRYGIILLLVNEGKLGNRETRIGVSSLAKGYILDQMIESIKAQGFDAIVDAGGDIRASGGPWKVAIQIPGKGYGENTLPFHIQNQALTTSGNYENKSNVIDPIHSKPVQNQKSVSIIADSATLANALSTAFYVLGESQSAQILSKFQNIKMIWTSPQGKMNSYCSTGKCSQNP